MSAGNWFKAILMLPGFLHINARAIAHRVKRSLRNRGGDLAKRSACCGPRQESFPEGRRVEDIDELKHILKPTGYLGIEYYPAYRCQVCGQEWFQDWEQLKFGGYIHVRKAT
jgi:hypothetical protein